MRLTVLIPLQSHKLVLSPRLATRLTDGVSRVLRLLRGYSPITDRWQDAPAKQSPLEHVRVCGIQVDISLFSIRRYLYGEDVDANKTPLTAEFDYRWQIVKDVQFLRETSLRKTTKRWMALHLSIDGEGANLVTQPKGSNRRLS